MRRIYLLAVFILIGGATLAPLLSDHHAPSYQVVHDWPQLPDGFVLGEVAGVGVDSHNHVFVFHRGSRPILCLDGASGKIVASWGDGMFGSAHGLDVDPQDNVWVTDTVHHQIMKFSHDGELLMTLGAKGVPGLDGNHFNKPTDIVVTSNGEFYVSDGYGNSRVAKFSAEESSYSTGVTRVTSRVSSIRLTELQSTIKEGSTSLIVQTPAFRSLIATATFSSSGRAANLDVRGAWKLELTATCIWPTAEICITPRLAETAY